LRGVPSEPAVVAVHPKNSVASRSGELSGMIKSMVDPVGSTSASKESAIVAFGRARRATWSALQPFFLVPKFDEEREKVLATRTGRRQLLRLRPTASLRPTAV
jgi:hypothetical protein